MTDNSDVQQPAIDRGAGDWLLQDFVSLINRTQLRVPVTLQLSGLTVSGITIDGSAYFRRLGDVIAEGMQSGNVSNAAESMREYFARYTQIYDKTEDEADEPPKPANYIHLENTRFWGTDGQTISSHGTLWRGRLSEVSGFFIGELSKG